MSLPVSSSPLIGRQLLLLLLTLALTFTCQLAQVASGELLSWLTCVGRLSFNFQNTITLIGVGNGGTCPPPPKIRKKYFSGNYYVKISAFFQSKKFGILSIFRANIMKIRVFW